MSKYRVGPEHETQSTTKGGSSFWALFYNLLDLLGIYLKSLGIPGNPSRSIRVLVLLCKDNYRRL